MNQLYHKIYRYFDKLEDRVRGRLSRYPIVYTLIAGTAIVLFWRGVWKTADDLAVFMPENLRWVDGPLSVAVSTFILLITGLFVSFFVSDQILISGIKKEKKMIEKTEEEVKQEEGELKSISRKIDDMDKELKEVVELEKK